MELFCSDAGTAFRFVKGEQEMGVGGIVNRDADEVASRKDTLKLMDCMDQNLANEIIDYLRTPARR